MITFTINSKFRFDMKQEIFPNSFTFNISRNFTTVEITIFFDEFNMLLIDVTISLTVIFLPKYQELVNVIHNQM